ncbi:MAG: phage holin family protein, partial [Gammaproteobacteria bacterium]
ADGMIYLAVAVVVLLGSFMVLLDAAVYGLSEIVAPGFAALIVAIVVAVIGVLVFQKGRNDLNVKNLLPEKTLSSVKRDTNFAK